MIRDSHPQKSHVKIIISKSGRAREPINTSFFF